MLDSLAGIRLKLRRTGDQIKALETTFRSYLQTDPYRPAVDFNPHTRILTVLVKIQKSPDPMWGVLIGEVIHNLRSALDHAVWELVILETGRPPKLPTKNQFPIFKAQEGFRDRGVPLQLRDVPRKAVTLIESEQPFATGEDVRCPLWHLNELSNADKHRTLHLTGTLLSEYSFEFPPLLEDIVSTQIERGAEGPMQQDAVLWRGHIAGQLPWPFAGKDVKGHLAMDIAFDQRTPAVGGWLVLGTLEDIAERTNRVITRIAAEIFKITL